MGLFKKKVSTDGKIAEVGKSEAPKQRIASLDDQLQSMSGDVGVVTENTKANKKKKKKQTQKEILKYLQIPKTAQQSIPYKMVYKNGIIESEDHRFTKCYRLTDTNFRTTTQEAQDEKYFAYGDLLNYFSQDIRPQIVIFNKSVDKEKFKAEMTFKPSDDSYNDVRDDINGILLDKISEGQNNIEQEKYLVVTVKADNIELANNAFARIDGEIASRIKVINEASTEPMTLQERLELLYNIYNQDTDTPFFQKANIDGNTARTFDLKWMQSLGLTTKDMIAPSNLNFQKSNYFKVGEKYGRSLFLRNLPTQLSADILVDIANIPCNALVSTHFSPMKQDEAIKLVRNQLLEISRNNAESAKRAAKAGLSEAYISPDAQQAKKEAEKAYEDLTVRDQKSILMTVIVTVFANDLDELDKYTNIVQNNGERHLVKLTVLNSQQENGFASSLPLGVNKVWADRFMNTESAALFIPFESQELIQPGGLYYGVNVTSRNLIMINRLRGQNSNGMILGMPGSGKSMAAKFEMTQAFLADKKNELFVVDPQAEYGPLAEQFADDSQVIRIAPGSDTHINPFDLDITNDAKDGDDPITVKSDYIGSICASAIGGHMGLNPLQTSVIDRVVRKLYEPYMEHMEELKRQGSDITCDRAMSPTFLDFYNLLRKQPEPEAEYIRIAIEKYCIGSYNTFAFPTNVETNKRFVVYNIRDIGTGMREMGMQICLNDIYSRTIANKKRGVRTWIYVDELYILTSSELCSRYLMYLWKQLRKFGGVCTGITQNVEDLTTNRESRALINNSPFILMLNQSSEDRAEIGSMLHISDAQLNYIKNADSGAGLIYCGKATVPFANRLSQDTRLYSVLSTNPNEA